jgi:hypothetical protein
MSERGRARIVGLALILLAALDLGIMAIDGHID